MMRKFIVVLLVLAAMALLGLLGWQYGSIYTALAAFVILLVAWIVIAKPDAGDDGGPMPVGARRLLVLYLLTMGVLLVICLTSLFRRELRRANRAAGARFLRKGKADRRIAALNQTHRSRTC
jgi:type VI protein secretion system component VasK